MKRNLRILSLALALLLAANLLCIAPARVAAEASDPFKSASVTLSSALQVNFTVEVSDIDSAQMTFSVNGATQTVSGKDAKPVEGKLYSFPCRINAAQMTDVITATLTDSGKTYTKETSVREYAQKLLASRQWHMLAANEMMLATLHYGGALQAYANHNTDNLANDGYTEPKAPDISYTPENAARQGSVTGITGLSASLILRNAVTVRFYIKLEGALSDYSITVNGAAAQAAPTEDGRYCIDYNNINPQQYKEDVTLIITKDNETMTVNYSPMRYISTAYNRSTTDAQLKTLLGRMYLYHEAAVSYVANKLGNANDNIVKAQ